MKVLTKFNYVCKVMTLFHALYARTQIQKPPKKAWNGFICGYYGCASLLGCGALPWSSFDLQTGQLSCSFSQVLKQDLSNA